MSIVAIAENLGSQGDEIGREVARALGWEFADREILSKAAEGYGEGVTELHHITDERPSLWERFTDSKRHYLSYVEATVFETAARGHAVLVGHGAAVMLRPVPHALRVRVTAPQPLRAERLRQQQGLTDQAAADLVRETDRERSSRIRYLYHVDLDDPLLYDLCINTERVSVSDAAAMVREALCSERLQPTVQSMAMAGDLSLAAQARARLLMDPRTRGLGLVVTATGGRLTVTGTAHSEAMRATALGIVRDVPGVADVSDAITVSQASRMYTGA